MILNDSKALLAQILKEAETRILNELSLCIKLYPYREGTNPTTLYDMTTLDMLVIFCNALKIRIDELTGKQNRHREIVEARMLYCWYCRRYLTTKSATGKRFPVQLKTIGRQLDQDHTTIIYSLNTIKDLIETNHAETQFRMLLVDAELNTILLEKKQAA